ncbi:uncharacterized protein LOC129565119 [Sitodiplosis mosellana]|uniref:uncharacterized protein LOC129565119 n=1 Tax=Sitodiplosis mosellana TaxID=263140 RepID=UPI002443C30F|nr:uncharacterized protein LOC129565119 [Sitodiplosis mosellana]
MSQTNMQKAYQLLIFVMLLCVGLSMARPNGSTDSQESSDNQLGVSDVDRSYPYYRPMQALQYFNYDEPNSVDRYQLQYRSFVPNNPGFGARGGGGSSNFPVWDSYRQLVNKRQTRYRQCYFNPISCFRK